MTTNITKFKLHLCKPDVSVQSDSHVFELYSYNRGENDQIDSTTYQ